MLTRRNLVIGGAALGIAASLRAEPETWEQAWQRRLREDWPGWRRYSADNKRIIAEKQPVDIVLMGDSITEGWLDKRPGFFTPGRVCRGVSGETTPQMMLRMIPDVCDLKPRAVHIMAGTNDIAGNTGAAPLKNTQDCFTGMHDIAKAHGIAVIFASVPPAAEFPWRPGLDTVTPIAALNNWLKDYAARSKATFVDYTSALSDGHGAMKPGLAYDGVHPSAEGYDVMASVLAPVLACHPALLNRKSHRRY